MKMRYSIEAKYRIYVNGYGFLSFAKNIDKSVNGKYSQTLFDSAKKSTTDAKLLQKEQFKKQQKQLVIWLVIKLLIK